MKLVEAKHFLRMLTIYTYIYTTLFKKILRSMSESTMISFLRSAEKAINHLEPLYIPVSTKNDESIFIVKREESLFYGLAKWKALQSGQI